jgi:ABC-type transporter Mla subunit MlaD
MTIFFGGLSLSLVASAAWADPCVDLTNKLNVCNAGLAPQQTEIQSRTADVQSLTNQVNQLTQEQNQGIPQCQAQSEQTTQQNNQMQFRLRDLQHARDEAAQQNGQVTAQYNELYQQKFVKWQCAIKDAKYANVGFGEGDTLVAARENAITSGQIGKQVNEAGEYDFCFQVFRN